MTSLILGYVAQTSGQSLRELHPPEAKQVPKIDTVHGDIRIDNYFWLRDKTNTDVIKHLEDENAYADALMKHTEALRDKLYGEMVGRIKETDLDVPYPEENYFYYTRTEKGKQYAIYCRKKGSLEAQEEITLNPNEMVQEHQYLRVGAYEVSPDQNLLAYSLDSDGSETFNLIFKNLKDGTLLSDRIPDMVSAVWAMDNNTIFYTTRDQARRPFRIFRHILGNDPTSDKLIYEEHDELYRVFISRTKSDRYILFGSSASTSDEVHFLPADDPMAQAKLILPREPDHEYSVDHHGDYFYILTNKHARNFRLVKAPVQDPVESKWVEVIPHRAEVTLEGTEFFKDFFVAFEREKGSQKMRVTDMRNAHVHSIDFPEPVYTAFNSVNRVFNTNIFRFTYQSFITPLTVYDYNLETRERTLLKRTEILGGFDPTQYESERIFSVASDGKEIPISLVYRKGMKRDGKAPLHLYGYGSYGISTPVTFSSSRLSLLDRGVTFAIAHVRGGGDMGREWKDDGRMLKKKNTFTDFIACAEHLIHERYTSNDRMTIEGGSAGGLLVGAVLNLRPDLFKAALAQVPFVDCLNTDLDASLPLTVGEYLEWGDPNQKEVYEYIKSYCPYTNVRAQPYPAMLVKVGLNDPRVGFWEGAKWVAKLRSLKTDSNPILLKVNMGAGHGGQSGRYDRLKEIAFDYAFLLSQYGLAN